MLKRLVMKCFRKHENTGLNFNDGLNLLRGGNEAGKSTTIEAILYALYGSKALRSTLEEAVTYGRKPSDLRVELDIEVGETTYSFTRSKGGAEVRWDNMLVTGQTEVTNKAAELLGADAKTAALLFLAEQGDLRGALSEGPTAVSGLIGKLADFDVIDQIIENFQNKYTLGADAPIREKLERAEAGLVLAQEDLASAEDVAAAEAAVQSEQAEVTRLESDLAAAQEKFNLINSSVMNLYALKKVYKELIARQSAAEIRVSALGKDVESAKVLSQCDVKSSHLDALRSQIAEAKSYSDRINGLRKAKNALDTLGTYPAAFWEGDMDSLTAFINDTFGKMSALEAEKTKAQNDIHWLEKQVISDGVCKSCGTDVSKKPDVIAKNEATKQEIAALHARILEIVPEVDALSDDWEAGNDILIAHKPYARFLQTYGSTVEVDHNFVPPKITWTVGDVDVAVEDVDGLQTQLRQDEAKFNAATAAKGRLEVLEQQLEEAVQSLRTINSQVAETPEPVNEELERQHDDLASTLTSLQVAKNQAVTALNIATQELAKKRQSIAVIKGRIEQAEARIVELKDELKQVAFNNNLLKKLRGLRPAIADHLWSQVLAAVSTFFSQMRGEKSIVTRENQRFLVNGQGVESLSGSTIDVLSLSVRVALVKTFISGTSFMILDEVAAACDADRASDTLGFLASVGLDQVLLASHDPVSESVADNVIQLGA